VLTFVLGVEKTVTEVDFTKAFGLFSQVCFTDASKLEPILEFVHGELFRMWNMLSSCKAEDVTKIFGFSLLQVD
jgi:hypothetical protein